MKCEGINPPTSFCCLSYSTNDEQLGGKENRKKTNSGDDDPPYPPVYSNLGRYPN